MITTYPMQTKSHAGDALDDFIEDVGIPATLIFDNAADEVGPGTKFMKTIKRAHIHWRLTEPYAHWQNNQAEDSICEVKKRWKRTKMKTGCSQRLWDFGIQHEAWILSRISRGTDGQTGFELATGHTPDISEDVAFTFYEPVMYITNPRAEDNPKLGCWLGVSTRVGGSLCYFVLTIAGNVISTSSLQQAITGGDEMADNGIQERIAKFDDEVRKILKDDLHTIEEHREYRGLLRDIDVEDDEIEPMENEPTAQEADDHFTTDAYDQYLGARLHIPRNGERVYGKVTKRRKDDNGNPIGVSSTNPILDSRLYEVEFDDGTTDAYFANTIAENIYAQVDSEGREYVIFKEITDHKSDGNAIEKADGFYKTSSGNLHPKRTTRGWKLCVEWNDGTTDWIPLKDLKESNPVEVAEYAIANCIADEPAFNWWVRHAIKKRNRILSKVKAKYWRTTHKFRIELPHSVEEAYAIDKNTGTLHWTNAIEKEMKKIHSLQAFEKAEGIRPDELRRNATRLPGHAEVGLHMIFDVKMDGKFTRKARLVANGNETPVAPKYDCYSSVVSRESVRIGFLYAALNNLDILSCDISNAYLNAPCSEKLWTEAGPEFGGDAGSVMIFKKAVYGLQTAGSTSWHETLAKTLTEMGFKPSRADQDVWLKESTDKQGNQYHEWIICYVDDLLAISCDPKAVMDQVAKVYDLKGTVEEPVRYLGANVGKWQLPDGCEVWCMSGKEYIKNAVVLVKSMLEKKGEILGNGKAMDQPMKRDYRPEIDVSPELGKKEIAEFQQLIGMLRWACELGRTDFLYELSLLSSHLALPREGHLEAAYNIFGYLAKHLDLTLVFDDKKPELNMDAFNVTRWDKSIYGDVQEELPGKCPKALGQSVQMTCFVDASYI